MFKDPYFIISSFRNLFWGPKVMGAFEKQAAAPQMPVVKQLSYHMGALHLDTSIAAFAY